VIDMAVGVIIATAFGKITTSLVNDVVMPAIGYFIGASDLSKLNIVLQPEVLNEAGEVVTPLVAIGIGTFLSTIVDFLLVALALFVIIRVLNRFKRKQEAAPAAAPAEEVLLLREIRDSLQTRPRA
jgi:large conductance mechanosensitive channel